MSDKTHDSLDAAIKAHMQDVNGSDATLITHWVLVVATVDEDGKPRVMDEVRDEQMPDWQIKGLLNEAMELTYTIDDLEGENDD